MHLSNPFRLLLLLILVGATLAACDSVEPDPGAGEEEFFTRVTLSLTGEDGTTVTATANDPDGDGIGIEYTTLTLRSGVTYTGALSLHDDINGEEVTGEIEEEGAAHLFFYTPVGGVAERLAVTRLDTDAGGVPLGLRLRIAVTEGGAASGELDVKLAHYENEADKRADHTPEQRPGSELDLDLRFPVVIE